MGKLKNGIYFAAEKGGNIPVATVGIYGLSLHTDKYTFDKSDRPHVKSVPGVSGKYEIRGNSLIMVGNDGSHMFSFVSGDDWFSLNGTKYRLNKGHQRTYRSDTSAKHQNSQPVRVWDEDEVEVRIVGSERNRKPKKSLFEKFFG